MLVQLFALTLLAAEGIAQRIDMQPPALRVRQTGAAAPITAATETVAASSAATINPSLVSAQLNSLLSANPVSAQFTTISETLGISVPSSLQLAIMTAVPGSVLAELMLDPAAKTSLSSEFAAGATPAWYTSMPADVQSWFEAFAQEQATGSPVFTVSSTAVPTTATGVPGDPEEGTGENVRSSSSKGVAAARTTGVGWEVMVSAVMVAGAVGVGAAL